MFLVVLILFSQLVYSTDKCSIEEVKKNIHSFLEAKVQKGELKQERLEIVYNKAIEMLTKEKKIISDDLIEDIDKELSKIFGGRVFDTLTTAEIRAEITRRHSSILENEAGSIARYYQNIATQIDKDPNAQNEIQEFIKKKSLGRGAAIEQTNTYKIALTKKLIELNRLQFSQQSKVESDKSSYRLNVKLLIGDQIDVSSLNNEEVDDIYNSVIRSSQNFETEYKYLKDKYDIEITKSMPAMAMGGLNVEQLKKSLEKKKAEQFTLEEILDKIQVIQGPLEGVSARVYIFNDDEVNKALKVSKLNNEITAVNLNEQETIRQLENEFNIIQKLRDIPELKDHVINAESKYKLKDGRILLIEEVVRGKQLKELIEKNELTLDDVAAIIRKILDLQNKFHLIGFNLYDWNFGNIYIDNSDGDIIIKLVDFGESNFDLQNRLKDNGNLRYWLNEAIQDFFKNNIILLEKDEAIILKNQVLSLFGENGKVMQIKNLSVYLDMLINRKCD